MNYTGKLDLTKIDKEKLFKSEKTGAIYLDIVIWESKEVKYDQTHMVVQSVSKEDRDAGVKGAILGNLKLMEQQEQQKSAEIKPNDLPF